jgi:hypothetical protein
MTSDSIPSTTLDWLEVWSISPPSQPFIDRERLEDVLLEALEAARGEFEANASSVAARTEYKRLLQLFTQFVVEGKIPADLCLCPAAA